MFRKVQLKFFGIITAILIAIFIALLFGINIIMDMLMERQTKVVLEQVASGVEYNNETNTFSFNYAHGEKPFKNDNHEPFPEITSTTSTSSEKPTETDKVTENTEVVTEITEAATEKSEDIQEEVQEIDTEPEIVETEPPSEEVTEEFTDSPPEIPDITENPPDMPFPPEYEWGERPKKPVPDRWHDDWNEHEEHNDWGEWENRENYPDYSEEKQRPEHEIWGDWGIKPMADTDFKPVIEGYTIIKDNPPPERRFEYEPVPKSFNSVDFFVIMADNNGGYLSLVNNDDMTQDVAQNYITQILNKNEKSGMTDNYSYCARKKNNGTVFVLSDRTAEINMMNKLKRTTVIVGIISIVVLSIGAYFISGLIVRPIKDTFEKQKQFISDASHELKTPLTVISANADVLSGEIGDNKWLNYIQDQAERMNVLVNDLLSLTRLENKNSNFIQTNFNLSNAITNTALPFECQAFETNKNFVINIDDDISVYGSEQHIKQMAGIFIDNALKYSKDGGTVRVSLTKEDGKTVFSVYNTGTGVKESEKDKIFERFYRSDESRNRATGGYGLGLAIAKSIIDKHKFKIDVENEEGKSICFVVTM